MTTVQIFAANTRINMNSRSATVMFDFDSTQRRLQIALFVCANNSITYYF